MQRYFIKNKDMLLEESDIRHIKKVMRMNINDKIEVVYNNKLHICEITSLEPFNIKVIEELDEDKKTKIELTVAVALVKEQKMDLILQKLTELGVSRIIPVSMERSIVKLDKERFNKKKVRWENICKEASEQSKRTNIPIIEDIKSIKDLTKEDSDLKLVASTKEKEKLLNYYLQSIEDCAKIIMVIGPEGGISDDEVSMFIDAGAKSCVLGSNILRASTAGPVALSLLSRVLGRYE